VVSPEAPAKPTSYSVVLPPEWIRVSLTSTVEQAVKDITDRTFANLPRDQFVAERRLMTGWVTDLVRRARDGNGLDLYLPVQEIHGRTVSASFVVGGALLPDDLDELESLALIADLAGDGRLVEVHGAPGVRIEKAVPGDETQGVDMASRRVDYTFPIPGDGRKWLAVTFSTTGAGDPGDEVADALVALFDAIMTTFRWRMR
jgi:hypothetical protein